MPVAVVSISPHAGPCCGDRLHRVPTPDDPYQATRIYARPDGRATWRFLQCDEVSHSVVASTDLRLEEGTKSMNLWTGGGRCEGLLLPPGLAHEPLSVDRQHAVILTRRLKQPQCWLHLMGRDVLDWRLSKRLDFPGSADLGQISPKDQFTLVRSAGHRAAKVSLELRALRHLALIHRWDLPGRWSGHQVHWDRAGRFAVVVAQPVDAPRGEDGRLWLLDPESGPHALGPAREGAWEVDLPFPCETEVAFEHPAIGIKVAVGKKGRRKHRKPTS